MLAPTGNGISATGLSIGGGNTGYIDTPIVSITGGGGVGATAVADIDYSTGVVTGITITNPGNGYTSAPTFTLIGGGGAATVGGTATLQTFSSGGLTKNGAGILDLTGANTYTGATVVNGGAKANARASGVPGPARNSRSQSNGPRATAARRSPSTAASSRSHPGFARPTPCSRSGCAVLRAGNTP